MTVSGLTPIGPTPPVAPVVHPSSKGGGGSFATLLGQRQSDCRAPEPAPSDAAPAQDDAKPAETPRTARPRSLPKPLPHPASPATDAKLRSETNTEADPTESAQDPGATPGADLPPWWLAAQAAQAPETAPGTAPGTLPGITSALREAAGAVDAPGAGEAAGTPNQTLAGADAATGANTKPGGAAPGLARSARERAAARADDSGAASGREAPGAAFAGKLAEQLGAERSDTRLAASAEAQRPIEAAGGPAAPAHGSLAASPGPMPGRDAANPLSVPLPTATASPEFPQALGVQVSLLARDGVQHAELHLNPSETGPVSVQIVMDGTQARVEFGADLAATRDAIQAGLPELAAALRDAGLTLSGGGVSQHAHGRGHGGRGDAPRDAAPARVGAANAVAASEPAPRVLRMPARAGGVDLYA